MKLEKMGDPFTGQEIDVVKFEDGSYAFDLAFSHETVAVAYNKELDAFAIPAKCFEYVHTLSLQEAADMLQVSKMRVSTLCAKGQLQHTKINGIIRIKYDSIVQYQNKRDSKGYKNVNITN